VGEFEEMMARLQAGEDLEAIERELIEPAQWLEPEERDALWLFAWSYRTRHETLVA
jgi:hypothetical protein